MVEVRVMVPPTALTVCVMSLKVTLVVVATTETTVLTDQHCGTKRYSTELTS
jgi:hypothetical protein